MYLIQLKKGSAVVYGSDDDGSVAVVGISVEFVDDSVPAVSSSVVFEDGSDSAVGNSSC